MSSACPACHILLVEAQHASIGNLGTAVDEAVTLGAKYVSTPRARREFSGELS